MSESGTAEDPLAGWDPRRRAALERLWTRFQQSAGGVRLSDEVIADRRRETAAPVARDVGSSSGGDGFSGE
jgi:hypothetical protein